MGNSFQGEFNLIFTSIKKPIKKMNHINEFPPLKETEFPEKILKSQLMDLFSKYSNYTLPSVREYCLEICELEEKIFFGVFSKKKYIVFTQEAVYFLEEDFSVIERILWQNFKKIFLSPSKSYGLVIGYSSLYEKNFIIKNYVNFKFCYRFQIEGISLILSSLSSIYQSKFREKIQFEEFDQDIDFFPDISKINSKNGLKYEKLKDLIHQNLKNNEKLISFYKVKKYAKMSIKF